MSDIRFTKMFRALVEDQLQESIADTGNGRCTDWAHYKYCVGLGEGLRRALEAVTTVENRLMGRTEETLSGTSESD